MRGKIAKKIRASCTNKEGVLNKQMYKTIKKMYKEAKNG